MRRFFEHPNHMLKLMVKKFFTILRSKLCLSKPLHDDSLKMINNVSYFGSTVGHLSFDSTPLRLGATLHALF